MTSADPAAVARRVRRAKLDQPKRRALLAALKSPDLVRCRLTSSGVLLEGPGGIVSTHLSSTYADGTGPLLRDLRKVGLL